MSTKLTSTTIILITISLFFVMMDIISMVVNVMFHKCCHYNDQLIRNLVITSKANNYWRKCACVRESCGPHEPELLVCSMRAPI
jgi:hypothetical protein